MCVCVGGVVRVFWLVFNGVVNCLTISRVFWLLMAQVNGLLNMPL